MSIYKNWHDIETDKDRLNAIDTFNSLRGKCSTEIELFELRQDIINSYLKQPAYNYD